MWLNQYFDVDQYGFIHDVDEECLLVNREKIASYNLSLKPCQTLHRYLAPFLFSFHTKCVKANYHTSHWQRYNNHFDYFLATIFDLLDPFTSNYNYRWANLNPINNCGPIDHEWKIIQALFFTYFPSMNLVGN